MSIKRYCDRCKRDVTCEVSRNVIHIDNVLNRLDLGHKPFAETKDIDLCESCTTQFYVFMTKQLQGEK